MEHTEAMKRAARDALQVQDACNMSGVVRSFVRHIDTLWVEANEKHLGTDWVNTHPVVKLFADKIVDLARAREVHEVSDAFDACHQLAGV